MLDQQGFDRWSEDYDRSVEKSNSHHEFPFAGYEDVLRGIYNTVGVAGNFSILDIGFGTGALTTQLYHAGHAITGIDFSPKMIALAQQKMPNAALIEWDFADGLPGQVNRQKYDYIVSTYAMHHLPDGQKIDLINNLLACLKQGGKILIGDVSFQTRDKLDECRHNFAADWDEEEFYFVADELCSHLSGLCSCEYQRVSFCAGILAITAG